MTHPNFCDPAGGRLYPLSDFCDACRMNDNYRWAYGCSGPCRNSGTLAKPGGVE